MKVTFFDKTVIFALNTQLLRLHIIYKSIISVTGIHHQQRGTNEVQICSNLALMILSDIKSIISFGYIKYLAPIHASFKKNDTNTEQLF